MGVIKKVAGRVVDTRVDKWMSWGYLSETGERFKFILLDIFIPKRATTSETFEEALQRLELTESDVNDRIREFTRLFYFFLGLSTIIIMYALYLAFKGTLAATIITFCLGGYALAQAFRFHFWGFQLKNRKLGCTIKEWLNSKIDQQPGTDLTLKNKQSISSSDKK